MRGYCHNCHELFLIELAIDAPNEFEYFKINCAKGPHVLMSAKGVLQNTLPPHANVRQRLQWK
jgi:hypothetical protein